MRRYNSAVKLCICSELPSIEKATLKHLGLLAFNYCDGECGLAEDGSKAKRIMEFILRNLYGDLFFKRSGKKFLDKHFCTKKYGKEVLFNNFLLRVS